MPAKKIFISYSRKNSEFAELFTRELQRNGADVWLDQFSIEAGTDWDSSIDQAIDECDVMLLICSKTSVASENVLDEVGFALGEGKTVIPVLIESCDIPFRVKRFTTYDLSRNLNAGMTSLLNALELEPNEDTTPWEGLERLKDKTTHAKKMRLLADKTFWQRHRKRSLLLIIAIAIPILTHVFYTTDIVGILDMWYYFLTLILSFLIASGIKTLFRKAKWGRRFLKLYADVITPVIIILFAFLGSTPYIFSTLPTFFLLVLVLVVRFPTTYELSANVDYFVNLIGLLMGTIIYILASGLDDGSVYLLPHLNASIGVAVLGSFILKLFGKSRRPLLRQLASYSSIGFFYLFIFIEIASNLIIYGAFEGIPFYLVLLLIGHSISSFARKTDWQTITTQSV